MSAAPSADQLLPYSPRVEEPTIKVADVDVDCGRPSGEITPLWAGAGYDEINWTYTPTGRQLLTTIRRFSARPYFVRTHYVFVSGNALSIPHWGSGNVYHEDAEGRPFYDFAICDQVYDTIVGAGHRPLVELGFTPRQLVRDEDMARFPYEPSPTQYSAYENGAWAYPPKDYGKWADLVAALVAHCRDRYGEAEVATWLWELWNEPDIFYWKGSQREFNDLYTVTARAVRSELPSARVGGPATTGDSTGPPFLRSFLAHCAAEKLPLDFVSFHTKGAVFSPWRTYGPLGADAPTPQSPSTLKMLREVRASLDVMADFPEFRYLPAVIDECDASVPAHWGRYDNANFEYRNTEYFPVFQVKLMKKLHDLNASHRAHVDLAMTWSFYIEGERYFEGTRSLLTADAVEKPVLNAYRLLEKLGDQRLSTESNKAWQLERLDEARSGMPEEVDGLASVDRQGRYAVTVWRHADDQYQRGGDAQVRVRLHNLPAARGEAVVTHWRIDGEYSNSHAAWRQLGAPQHPTPDQVAAIKSRQGLEQCEPPRRVSWEASSLELRLMLPLPSVSLIEVDTTGSRT